MLKSIFVSAYTIFTFTLNFALKAFSFNLEISEAKGLRSNVIRVGLIEV